LIGQEVAPIARSAAQVKPVSTDDLDSWERKIEQRVAADPSILETERLAIIYSIGSAVCANILAVARGCGS
jgi:hypothetical protein